MTESVPVFYAPKATSVAASAAPFLSGVLLQTEEGGERCFVQPDGDGSPFWLQRSAVFLKSPAAGSTGVPDNAQLFYLDEPNLLDNLSVRYTADEIYTYTGHLCYITSVACT